MTRDELITRLEAAVGLDRELDAAIANHIGLYHDRYGPLEDGITAQSTYKASYDVLEVQYTNKHGGGLRFTDKLPAYTGSLDAALTLVPTKPVPELRPGKWWWLMESWPDECTASVHYENGDSGIIEEEGKADTPALALCIAALKARFA